MMAEDRVEYARTTEEAEAALARVLATADENGHTPFLGAAVIRGNDRHNTP